MVSTLPALPAVRSLEGFERGPSGGRHLPRLPALVPRGEVATSVRVRAPCSVANVGPGFDHFGLCLEGPEDILELRRSSRSKVEVFGDGSIPTDPTRNVATVAADALLRGHAPSFRVDARLFKGFRSGSGIGSSAASAVAGALAAAALLGLDPTDAHVAREVLEAAALGESVASGGRHLDNVSASLFGGFVLVEPGAVPRVHRLPPLSGAKFVLALPDLRVETRRARSVLPDSVPRSDAVLSTARAGALLHGWLSGDVDQVARNLEDRLAEPYREPLVPGLASAKASARRAGARGVVLAGSGPAVLALGDPQDAPGIARGLEEGFRTAGVEATTFLSSVGRGAWLSDWC